MFRQQMKKADRILAERRKIAGWYDKRIHPDCVSKGLARADYRLNSEPAFYKYVVFNDVVEQTSGLSRDAIRQAMEQKGIAMPGLVYEVPLHCQPAMWELQGRRIAVWGDLHNSNWVADHHLCLPLHLGMTEEEVDYVVESLKEVLG